MLLTMEILKTKNLEELRTIYQQKYGTKPHHLRREESIIVDILKVDPEVISEGEPKTTSEIVFKKKPQPNTSHAIAQALSPYVKRGLIVNVEDDCWHIKVGVAEDSGHVTMPINLIMRKAEVLMGSRMPRVEQDSQGAVFY